ncbi:MAG: helix-turn-helix transcriptional regulator [Brumimicrobium sp.]
MDKVGELKQLGAKVREIRTQKGLTQTELANKIGKDHPSVNKLENGKVNPSYLFLLEVCQGLEIELKQIL